MIHHHHEVLTSAQENAMRRQLTGRGRNIEDERVIRAMLEVPRHAFVPGESQDQAYADSPLSIGYGQTISQPYVVAYMAQALRLRPADRVLEIGVGSGYQTAVLSCLVQEVCGMEIVEPLASKAIGTLRRIGTNNVRIRVGDGYAGWPDEGPYDAVIVACAPNHIPQGLVDQLKNGGRMVLPVGDRWSGQELWLLEKTGGKLSRNSILPVRFVPMTGRAANG